MLAGAGQQGAQGWLDAPGRHDDRIAPNWSTAAESTTQMRRFTICAFTFLAYRMGGPIANA